MKNFKSFGTVEGNKYDLETVTVCQTQGFHKVAELATILVEKWGMVAAIPDGEDSAGRSKLRLLTPEKVVNRATETADLLWSALEDKGWLFDVPLPTVDSKRK